MINKLIVIFISTIFCQNLYFPEREPSQIEIPNYEKSYFEKFSMDHSLSFLSSINGTSPNNFAVYSNLIEFKYNERIKLHSNIQFVLSNPSLGINSRLNENLQYNLGFEYKISEKSLFLIQFSHSTPNIRNQLIY